MNKKDDINLVEILDEIVQRTRREGESWSEYLDRYSDMSFSAYLVMHSKKQADAVQEDGCNDEQKKEK